MLVSRKVVVPGGDYSLNLSPQSLPINPPGCVSPVDLPAVAAAVMLYTPPRVLRLISSLVDAFIPIAVGLVHYVMSVGAAAVIRALGSPPPLHLVTSARQTR